MYHYLRDPRTLWGLTLGPRADGEGRARAVEIYLATWCSFRCAFTSAPSAARRCSSEIMVVHFALVPLFINPRDGLLVTSGLMSADFARELRAS